MLKRVNYVQSDRGFRVSFLNRKFMVYSEGEREVKFEAEALSTGYVIWSDSLRKWNSPYDLEEITAEKKTQIMKNVAEALRFCSYQAWIR